MSFQLQNSQVLARLKPFGISFEKSLSDLIKGIRSHSKESPEALAQFLDVAIQECKTELSTTDLETKAMAILKLAYLEMYGFDMSWCNFHILEIMSSGKFQQKRIGYLAAIQSFKNEQDLLILATNQFKKDLNSHNHIEIGLALSGIATIVTPNLAKDINDDVLMKLNHSKPYIRKKAILAMYKIFLQYPDSLRLNFQRVIDKLDDPDISVISATVNVICEISKKNPNIFINYLPKLFTILEDTKNNWLIIRILKLFQSLSKVEPRMKRKILPTIMDLMLRTQASSLIYECINCIVNGQMLSTESFKDSETAKTCIDQLMTFFKTNDSNLKFVGLLALINILKIFPIFIDRVEGVSQVIMDCLVDPDIIIKQKALQVCHYLVNEDNITEVVKLLLTQLIPTENSTVPQQLKLEVTLKLLEIATLDNYANIPNFKWYVAVLKDVINLTLLPLPSASTTISPQVSNSIAIELGKEFKNLATKVPSIRPTLLNNVITFIQDVRIIENCPSLLTDFYWIMGEYIDELREDSEDSDDEDDSQVILNKKIKLFNLLVNNNIDKSLGLTVHLNFPISAKLVRLGYPSVLAVVIQALVKLFNSIVSDYAKFYSSELPDDKYNEICYYLYKLVGFLSNWETHQNYEVQERALSWLEFLKLSLEAMTGDDLSAIKLSEEKDITFYKLLREAQVEESEEDSEEESEEEDSDDNSDDDSDEYGDLESDDEMVSTPIAPLPEFEPNPFAEIEQTEQLEQPVKTQEEHSQLPAEISLSEARKLPILLTTILPSFFKSYQLNPVSRNAQRSIAVPEDLDLDSEISSVPFTLELDPVQDNDSYNLYISEVEEEPLIQLTSEETFEKKKERMNRLKDDPYYINPEPIKTKKKSKSKTESESVTPESYTEMSTAPSVTKKSKKSKLKKEKVVILSEETVEGASPLTDLESSKKPKKKKNALKIDSSNLDNFNLSSSDVLDVSNKNEYEIDLESYRNKLAEAAQEEKPKKKKKSKTKKIIETEAEVESVHSTRSGTGSPDVITVKPKKTKKKTKAVILE
ncbi:uncharacterized protein SPAPADRAFT_67558 [Spathaspora passalidarum NRRL Y-27907]|uniref:AP-3 complex subunit delta n=1 Tax=Spathaspora passalidarum (strain NRRL Y-27907 / 11-Y1) TaxID=619300 RepID=G3AQF8_SPAPN|nr:uncharacterized protein SPAPADRAFT_67558 [Spathaspora passalidarum NRRL Y-27907]EGW31504.1 hypothetical protein SPAPADRAFT_67558 [Spathaspora passalidarum NRRL Y-27907]